MTGGVCVAIDQGGHATRASAYSASGDLEGAALVTIATQRNALGHVEHDPEEVVASVETALAELARLVEPSRWTAAGLAVQRSILVCWDTARSLRSFPGRTRAARRGCEALHAGRRTCSA